MPGRPPRLRRMQARNQERRGRGQRHGLRQPTVQQRPQAAHPSPSPSCPPRVQERATVAVTSTAPPRVWPVAPQRPWSRVARGLARPPAAGAWATWVPRPPTTPRPPQGYVGGTAHRVPVCARYPLPSWPLLELGDGVGKGSAASFPPLTFPHRPTRPAHTHPCHVPMPVPTPALHQDRTMSEETKHNVKAFTEFQVTCPPRPVLASRFVLGRYAHRLCPPTPAPPHTRMPTHAHTGTHTVDTHTLAHAHWLTHISLFHAAPSRWSAWTLCGRSLPSTCPLYWRAQSGQRRPVCTTPTPATCPCPCTPPAPCPDTPWTWRGPGGRGARGPLRHPSSGPWGPSHPRAGQVRVCMCVCVCVCVTVQLCVFCSAGMASGLVACSHSRWSRSLL
jgi:hypothetical protein